MRRIVPFATLLLLSGCGGSGFYSYLGDTTRVPFHSNPNAAPGHGETYDKVVAIPASGPAPLLYQPGDVWPAAPLPPPTLKQLQAEGAAEMQGGHALKPLQPLPQLPGYTVPQQETPRPLPKPTFSSGMVHQFHGPALNTGTGALPPVPGRNGSIIVPNGNGTSTVIGPTGTVTTIPTPRQ